MRSTRYLLGEFDTAEAAIAACQKVVNECLDEFFKPGMIAAELSTQYTFFGEDPFIEGEEKKSCSPLGTAPTLR